jgi:aspartyl-tRNA synthetase
MEVSSELLEKLKSVRGEFVIGVEGRVVGREQKNPNMPTGEIEVRLSNLLVFNTAQTPPIPLDETADVNEDLRLKYRFLDLRRESLQKNIALRSKISNVIRNYFHKKNFLEIETPILGKSTVEGARDYLVPSRLHKEQFFALPQSPQIYKQLLQIAGFERYFQICRCFRDEDLRADRQPEFTQVDVEMSFIRQEDIQQIIESLLVELTSAVGKHIITPFPRITYSDAMEYYGSDKPDTRCSVTIQDTTHLFTHSKFNLFANAANSENKQRIRALFFPGEQTSLFSRKRLDALQETAKYLGCEFLPYIKWGKDGLSSNIKKFLSPTDEAALIKEFNVTGEGIAVFAVGTSQQTSKVLGEIRLQIAKTLGLIDESRFDFLWVIDFPLLEWREEHQRFTACHHPFTSPNIDDIDLLESNPAECRSQAYDVILNGTELGGGSIRIHDAEIQSRVFKAIGITEVEAMDQFGFLLDALTFGAPPHGGIALGLDRLIMLLVGASNIREVIAFPKTAQTRCLMTNAPSNVKPQQLEELNIQITK